MEINLTYEQYCTLVLSGTQAYDVQHITKANSRGTRRSVYDSVVYHQSTENGICESYNMDSSISKLNNNTDNIEYSLEPEEHNSENE